MNRIVKRPDLRNRFEEKYVVEPNTGCWLWFCAINSCGYGSISSGGRILTAHRASWEIHRGSVPDGQHVLHKCDTRACVNPDHLFLGTNYDNVQDKIKKGRDRKAFGEQNGMAKLDRDKVIDIRRLLAAGKSKKGIARQYGVTDKVIFLIDKGKTWAHI